MELAVKDLNRYCAEGRYAGKISDRKFNAAHDYLHALVFDNPKAKPKKPLRKFFDRALINKIKELAADALVEKESGKDRLERTLIDHATTFKWPPSQLKAGLWYLQDLRQNTKAVYYPSSLTEKHAAYIKDLSFQYGNVYA